MADMNKEFDIFHGKIALTGNKKEQLKSARKALRDRIRKYFQNELQLPTPKFRGQGSYSMGTTVNPISGEFDIDDGVYLLHLNNQDDREWPSVNTVHNWLVNATDGHTNEKPIDKNTCVRVRYTGKYHVDLPIYGELRSEYLLADKKKGWNVSDPLAITDWFQGEVNEKDQQLRRLVRFLKTWADFQSTRRGKMPSGLILTVLGADHFRNDVRDDKVLAETVREIANTTQDTFVVFNPVNWTEELTERLNSKQKEHFQDAISEFADEAEKAVDSDTNPEEASKIWRQQFGDRFPKVETNSNQEKKETAAAAAAYAGNKAPKPWTPIN